MVGIGMKRIPTLDAQDRRFFSSVNNGKKSTFQEPIQETQWIVIILLLVQLILSAGVSDHFRPLLRKSRHQLIN